MPGPRETLTARLGEAMREAGFTEIPPAIVSASDTRFGDYQANVAMVLAKQRKANPRQIANEILAKLDVSGVSEMPDIAGAGFINFRLTPDFLAKALQTTASDERLGVASAEPKKRFIVDFSSPNVAKQMHVGHIRSTFLGDTIARIAEFLGHNVVRDNHIGDWGTQFGMLLIGWKTQLDQDALKADPIAEMERIYKDITARCKEDETIRAAARAELVKLQGGDEANLKIWQEMIRLSESQFDMIYRRLGVRFDVTLGESFYNPWLKEVIADLKEKNVVRESDGAWCVFSDGSLPQKEDPFLVQKDGQWEDIPAIVLKEDGGANYTTTDLATLQYRQEKWSPDEIVYVTDGRQQLHFRQIFTAYRRWKGEAAANVRLSHVWFGAILGEDGKPFKTRSGDTVKLADLLDEAEERAYVLVSEKNPGVDEAERREIARKVGLGAIKYADLLPSRQGDYIFSWDKMLSFQGNTAPYLQYSYVRVRSIFRKLEDPFDPQAPVVLTEPAERALALRLLQFGEVLPGILEEYRPNLLANYLYELAGAFHSFFEACPVLKADPNIRASRLVLCDLTARTLRQGLDLLGIECPERM